MIIIHFVLLHIITHYITLRYSYLNREFTVYAPLTHNAYIHECRHDEKIITTIIRHKPEYAGNMQSPITRNT